MIDFILYDLGTGEIKGNYRRMSLEDAFIPEGWGRIEGVHDMQTSYVLDGEVVPRTDLGVQPDTLSGPPGTMITFSGLPADVQFSVNGEDVTVADGILELNLTTPGEFDVRLQDHRFLPEEWILTCNDAS